MKRLLCAGAALACVLSGAASLSAAAVPPSRGPREILDDILEQARALSRVPDPKVWLADCEAHPLTMAQSLGLPIESAVPPAASLLCSRDLNKCTELLDVVSEHRSMHLQDLDLLHMDELEEIPEDTPECRAWASSFLFLASILENKPDEKSCQIYVQGLHLGFKPPVSDEVCRGLTKGLLSRDVDTVCREMVSHVGAEALSKMGGETNLMRLCLKEYIYVRQSGRCSGETRPRSLSQCRLWSALQAEDPGQCQGDAFCLAFFQKDSCDETRFLGLDQNPQWKEICPALRQAALAKESPDFEAKSRTVRAALLQYEQELPSGLTAVDGDAYSKRIAQALASLDDAEKARGEFLHGGEAPAVASAKLPDRKGPRAGSRADEGLSAPSEAGKGDVVEAGIDWIAIPGGRFMMGSDKEREKPAHPVTIPPFEMAKTAVTNKQYRLCVEAGACTPPDDCGKEFAGDDQPVVCVDWYQARAFCAWVGGRLPSEAEWEYAARSGGKDWEYPWGNEEATCARAVVLGCRKGPNAPAPVCSQPAGNSLQGLCDMAGNVWEWVEDYHHYSYDGAPDDGSAWEDSGVHRMARGGCWLLDAAHARSRYRHYYDPRWRPDYIGFRPARSVGQAPPR